MSSTVSETRECSVSMELQDRADRELARRSIVSMLAMLLVVPILGVATEIPVRHPLAYIGIGTGLILIAVVRLAILMGGLPRCRRQDRCRVVVLKGSVVAASALWSTTLAHVLMEEGLYSWDSMMLLMIYVGIGGGAIGTLVSHYRLLVLHISLCLLPAVAVAAMQGGQRGGAVACGLLLLLGFLVFQGWKLNRHYWQGIEDNRRLKLSYAELETARANAEQAARVKSAFLTNMSHELRTPMHGVLGMIELARETNLNPEQREYLDMAYSSAQGLLRLLNQLLELSRWDSRHRSVAASSFSLQHLLEEVSTPFTRQLEGRPVRLVPSVSPAVSPHLIGAPEVIEQVLTQLVDNALKFTENGEVRISVGLEPKQDGPAWVYFEVSDTGIGIPAGLHERIFDAFVQGDSTLHRRHGGAGIGLTLCAKLVMQLGGQLQVRSTPGLGSAFWFSLPLEAAAETGQDECRLDRIPA